MSTTAQQGVSKGAELSRVWEPLQLGNLTLRNRILQPAHSSQHGDARDHVFSDRQIAYFRERAKGGVALAITETVAAARSALGSFFHIVDVWNEACIPSMEKLADAVHEHEAKIFVQLASMGVHDRGRMFIDHNKPIWGASRIPSVVHNEIPLVMGPDEIAELTHDFGQSAANVKQAGLDGVELHGAHSYGLGQFMSPTYNKRDDAYGGTPAKRCQLMIECAEQVRERVGPDFVVGVRLSWDEFLGPEGGITPEQAEEQVDVLATTGLCSTSLIYLPVAITPSTKHFPAWKAKKSKAGSPHLANAPRRSWAIEARSLSLARSEISIPLRTSSKATRQTWLPWLDNF